MDKKTILVIIFTLIFMAIIIYIVTQLIGEAGSYVNTFLIKLEQTVEEWLGKTFG